MPHPPRAHPHESGLELESRLSAAKQDGEQLSPGERRRRAALANEMLENIRANREYFVSGITRRLLLAFGQVDSIKLLSAAGQADADGPGLRCMKAEMEFARVAANVLGGFLDTLEHQFGVLIETVQRTQPEQWEGCGKLFRAIPPHLVKPLYEFALAENTPGQAQEESTNYE